MPPQRGGRALYPQQGQPAIYGAHGQPLGNLPPQSVDPHYQHPPPQGYPMQSPTAPYGQVFDERGAPPPAHMNEKVSRKRPRTDDSHPAVPPPNPPQSSSSHPYQGRPPAPNGRRGSGGNGGYEYPDPTAPRLLHPTPLPHIQPSLPSLTTALRSLNRVVVHRRVSRRIRMMLGLLDLHMGVRPLPAIFIPAAYTHRRCCRTEPDERRRQRQRRGRRRGRGAITEARKDKAWRFVTC